MQRLRPRHDPGARRRRRRSATECYR